MTSRDITTAAAGVRGGEVGPTDPDFESTVLLINGDNATNGGQNNTFLDSSINNHTITRNGNVTQGSFSPFSVDDGKWGNYFAQNNSWLIIPETSSEFTFGTGDFTIETWFYHTDDDGIQLIFEWRSTGGGSGAMPSLFTDGSGNLSYYRDSTIFSTAINQNQWHHVALVRDSGTLNMYLDGVPVGSTADTNSYIAPEDGNVKIGALNNAYDFSGYISNFRVVKGNAVYTSAFTPPTGPLTAISGTSLLTCQSNRFVDNSSNNHEITANGTPKVVPFSPFAPSTAYNTSTKGGSGYFSTNGNTSSSSGTGQYLYTEYKSEFALGTNDFTIKFWCYPNEKLRAFPRMIQIGPDNTAWGASQLAILHKHNDNSDEINVAMNGIGGNALLLNSGPIADFQWIHVALTRSGSTFTLYINGQSVDTYTNSGSATGTGNKVLLVGSATAGNSDYNGYISNLYINNGVAESITLPTSLETDTTQEALLNFTNASIVDATGKNVLETVGNAQVDTTTVKYGTGALEVNGVSGYLTAPDSVKYDFGTGDFTFECWLYATATNGEGTLFSVAVSNGINIFVNKSSQFGIGKIATSSGLINFGSAPALNQWNHVAVSRSSGTTYGFINGTISGSSADTNNYVDGGLASIGIIPTSTGNNIQGYIDDLRITKGVARYTTNFTPPEAALPVIGEE